MLSWYVAAYVENKKCIRSSFQDIIFFHIYIPVGLWPFYCLIMEYYERSKIKPLKMKWIKMMTLKIWWWEERKRAVWRLARNEAWVIIFLNYAYGMHRIFCLERNVFFIMKLLKPMQYIATFFLKKNILSSAGGSSRKQHNSEGMYSKEQVLYLSQL